MRTYKAEQDAGINLEDASASAIITAKVKIEDIEKLRDGISVEELLKAEATVQTVEELIGQKQPDLALVVAILVSTGWNLNDDVFTPEELWKARTTPIHKPMNYNHDPKIILGHIIQSRVLDKSGNVVENIDDDNAPSEFDIEVAGVLYKGFPELADKVDEIITKANAGEMFVSMEVWFPDFGYGIVAPDGSTKIVERTEGTAFLTKHLQIYGGSGEYQGYRVGRVLKDLTFGAQGFVSEPANPDSVIKVAASKAAASSGFGKIDLNELLEGGVEDVDKAQLEELQEQLAEALASLDSKDTEVVELQKKVDGFESRIVDLNSKIEELNTTVAETSSKVDVADEDKAELQKSLDEMIVRAEKSEAELNEIRKNEMARDRLSKLSEVKVIADEEAAIVELRDMTEDTFAVVLKYAGEAKSDQVVDESEKKTDTEVDEGEQAEAALDSIKEDKDEATFVADENSDESKGEKWVSFAKALTGNREN